MIRHFEKILTKMPQLIFSSVEVAAFIIQSPPIIQNTCIFLWNMKLLILRIVINFAWGLLDVQPVTSTDMKELVLWSNFTTKLHEMLHLREITVIQRMLFKHVLVRPIPGIILTNMELWLLVFLCKHYDSLPCLLLFLFSSWFLHNLFEAETLNLELCLLWNLGEQVSSKTFFAEF